MTPGPPVPPVPQSSRLFENFNISIYISNYLNISIYIPNYLNILQIIDFSWQRLPLEERGGRQLSKSPNCFDFPPKPTVSPLKVVWNDMLLFSVKCFTFCGAFSCQPEIWNWPNSSRLQSIKNIFANG